MQEAFLHFLWKFQYFTTTALQTVDGRPMQVIRPGLHNTDAGPDFLQARLVVGGVEWAGSVEMHLRSSDWAQHRHQGNPAYENVVLHVVWEHNEPVRHPDGTEIPVVSLQSYADLSLLHRYEELLANLSPVPCAAQFGEVREIHKRQALDNALMSRLQQKAREITELYERNQRNWEETAYQVLARNFGFKINAEPMLDLAQSVPLKILQKHADSPLQMEALLFGQAGLLLPADDTDSHAAALRREHRFLRHKYGLPEPLSVAQWKFLRLRPANFPTLRLAQLTALLHRRQRLFSSLLALQSPADMARFVDVPPLEYWQNHYHFGKASTHSGRIGTESQYNLLVNSVVPLLAAYAEVANEQSRIDQAVTLLEALPAEDNKIVRMWADEVGLTAKTAFDAQAAIGLYNHGCSQRRCLSCPIGVALLRPAAKPEVRFEGVAKPF
ncbi:MAG: DUF2851 family protein [Cytophagales bacterium]|nr:DUF2851 family protein [Cytophagales bacterium]